MIKLNELVFSTLMLLSVVVPCFPAVAGSQVNNFTSKQMKEFGIRCTEEGNYAEALKCFRQSMARARKEGDQWMEASCQGNIGAIFAIMNDYGSASFYFEKSYQTAVKINADDLAWIACSNLVIAYSKMGKLNEAMEYAKNNVRVTPSKPTSTQKFMLKKNDYIIASCRKDARKGLAVAKEMHNFADSARLEPFYQVTSLSFLGEALQNNDSIAEAISCIKEAIALAENSNLHDFKAQALTQLANAYAAANLFDLEEETRKYAVSYADSLYVQSNFEDAKRNFLTQLDQDNQQLVANLKRTINWQTVTILVICVLFVAIAVMAVIMVGLNKKLKRSYKTIYDRYSEIIELQENNLETKYGESPADGIEAEEHDGEALLLSKIMKVLDNPEFTTNPDFSISVLTREVGSNTKYVSTVINRRFNRNFRTVLNEKRIKEACRLILHNPKMTSQELAERSGYKSVSGFYTSFKAILAMTPAEFRRQNFANRRQ